MRRWWEKTAGAAVDRLPRPGRRWLRRGSAIAALMLISGVSVVVLAGVPGSIRGTVRMQGKGIANHRIMLIRFGPGQQVQRTPGQTDAEGRFTFDHLETNDAFAYVVGIRYADRLYRSPSVRLQSGQQLTDLVVEVQPAATAPGVAAAALHIANHIKIVLLQDDHLMVREIIRLVKSAPAAGATDRFSLYLPLPQGHGEVTDIQGLDAAHVRLEPAGLFYTAPLASGEHRIIFSYDMPFRHRVITMLAERSLPTLALDILVQDTHLVTASNLHFEGRVSFESHVFTHFRGTDLLPQSRSWLQITRQRATVPFLRVGAYGVIIVMVLLGIGGTWVSLRGGWRRSAAEPVSPATDVRALEAARLRLLDAVARLDDAHAAGTVTLTTYRRQRAAYKQQLLDLYQHLQTMAPNKGVLADGGE